MDKEILETDTSDLAQDSSTLKTPSAEDFASAKTVRPIPTISNFTEYKEKLKEVIDQNIKDVEECESNIDRLFGNALKENDTEFFKDENNILDVIEQFKSLTLTPSSSGELIRLLANDMSQKLTEETLPKSLLAEVRPCRPLEKVTFVNSLMLSGQQNNWSADTKAQVKATIFEYFEKELADDTNLLNVNLQATLLESMVDAGYISEKYEDAVIDLRDSMEDDQDDILDALESKGENDTAMSFSMVSKEYKKAAYYREKLLELVREVQNN